MLVSAAAVALAIGCDQETITLPAPPMAAETQQLVAVYDMPTATLNVGNIQQAAADARARLQEIQPDWFPGVVSDLLTRLRARLDDGSLPTDPASAPKAHRAQITPSPTFTASARAGRIRRARPTRPRTARLI